MQIKKGKIEKGAKKTGKVVRKIGKTGCGAVKGFGKELKGAFTKKEEGKN